MLNYIFVITFTPSLLVLKSRHIDNAGLCVKEKAKDGTNISEANAHSSDPAGMGGGEDDIAMSGKISRCFTGAMLRKVGGLQLLPIILILTLTGLGVWGIATAATMTPPTSEEKWFPDDHMITGIRAVGQTYLTGRDDDYEKFQIVFGIKGVDRSAFSRWLPNQDRGKAEFDPSFNFQKKDVRTRIKRVCDDLAELKCKGLAACRGEKLVGREGTLRCFVKDFEAWWSGQHFNETIEDTERTAYLTRLVTFRKTTPLVDPFTTWQKDIGIVDDELKFVTIQPPRTFSSYSLAPSKDHFTRNWKRSVMKL